jgi:hypothetical protein
MLKALQTTPDNASMVSASLLAVAGNGLFVLAMLVAAIRCLMLWRRTRRTPELSIGLGFFLVAGLGYPLMALSGIGGSSVAELDPWIFGAGLGVISLGVVSLQSFTRQAFRAGQGWATALVALTFLAAVVICWGSVRSMLTASPETPPVEAGQGWLLGVRLLFEAWYVWTAIEGLLEYRQARRRLKLNLSDPIVVNRFLLWGVMGVFLTLNGAVAAWLEWQGASPLVDLAPALVLAANGGVAGLLILLTFMPPQAYVHFVRRRALAGA